jgi:hypothetical protein
MLALFITVFSSIILLGLVVVSCDPVFDWAMDLCDDLGAWADKKLRSRR